LLNEKKASGDWVFMVSDNESWVDSLGLNRFDFTASDQKTKMQLEWDIYKQRNPAAKLVCLDIQPHATSQIQDRTDVLNIGGMNDQCFEIVGTFLRGELLADHWLGAIGQVSLL
jgi:60 kDa SS-A/Ro ribonucleoprotein